MEWTQAIALIVGGLIAGIVNTLAGGGALLTVPLLVLFGLPGNLANGTNRIGVLAQSLVATSHYHSEGVLDLRASIRVLLPLCFGSLVGAAWVLRIEDQSFERIFGVLMLLLLVPTVRGLSQSGERREPWPAPLVTVSLLATGLYAGAFQAGVGLILLAVLERAGFDLVRANAMKMLVITALTAVALPVFILNGQVLWLPALVLALGFSAGGSLGARLALRGGERLIRWAMVVAILVLAARMLGLWMFQL